MLAFNGRGPVMSLSSDPVLRFATAGVFCLVCACSSEEQQPGPGPATGGGMSASGGAIGSGGMPAAGSGGITGGVIGSGGTPAAGSGGVTGGVIGSGGTPAAGSGGGGAASVAGNAGSGGTSGSGSGTFSLTSPAFDSLPGCAVEAPAACDVFPDENVSYMERPNQSPELRWTGVPSGTQSFAIVLMDATYGQAHWALWNIPANVTMLAANVPKDTATPSTPPGSRQSNANFANGGDGYFGPHVPCNVFEFEIYALSTPTFSPMDPDSAVLVAIELQELKESVLGLATLVGRSGDYGMTCVAP
jgi:Raf kinase inhibitor-like YbhB/YbcL family protein